MRRINEGEVVAVLTRICLLGYPVCAVLANFCIDVI